MKYVYSFKEGNKDMRELLGGKGANLAEMTGIGLPVPRGFTVTTEACTKYYDDGKMISEEIVNQIYEKLEELEEKTASEGFWDDMENSQKILQKMKALKSKLILSSIVAFVLVGVVGGTIVTFALSIVYM